MTHSANHVFIPLTSLKSYDPLKSILLTLYESHIMTHTNNTLEDVHLKSYFRKIVVDTLVY